MFCLIRIKLFSHTIIPAISAAFIFYFNRSLTGFNNIKAADLECIFDPITKTACESMLLTCCSQFISQICQFVKNL